MIVSVKLQNFNDHISYCQIIISVHGHIMHDLSKRTMNNMTFKHDVQDSWDASGTFHWQRQRATFLMYSLIFLEYIEKSYKLRQYRVWILTFCRTIELNSIVFLITINSYKSCHYSVQKYKGGSLKYFQSQKSGLRLWTRSVKTTIFLMFQKLKSVLFISEIKFLLENLIFIFA